MFYRMLFITLLSMTLMSASCEKTSGPQQNNDQMNPVTISTDASNSLTDFAFDFFKNLQPENSAKDNLFVSPLSLHMAMGILLNGAEEKTKDELMQAMKVTNLSLDEINETHKKLITQLPLADSKVKLTLANSVWHKNTFTVKSPFLETAKGFYDANVTAMPFVQSDVDIINQWASDKTNGKIPKVLSEINPLAVMFIMNALYFKGDWRNKFDAKNTVDRAFHSEDGTKKVVKMMNKKDTMFLAKQSDFSAVQVPYGNGQFAATFILPNENKKIADVFNSLNLNTWKQLFQNSKMQQVQFGLPKFTYSGEYQLKKTLNKMGVADAFSSTNANFKKISDTYNFVDFIKQNTYLGIDEVGTEAAAVTTIGMIVTSAPMIPEFICDRPFGIIISEKTSNTILFMGKIMSP